MTMARIKDDKVVAVGLPDSLESTELDRLYALEFRRTNKDLLALPAELGYTEDQLDDIFGINS